MTPPTEDNHLLRIGLAQIAPVWLDRERTILKVKTYVERASEQGCHLVAFGEALVPGYPFWLELTDGARFNSSLQKSIFAEYAEQAVQPEAGHLDGLCAAAAAHRIAIYLGTVERAADGDGNQREVDLPGGKHVAQLQHRQKCDSRFDAGQPDDLGLEVEPPPPPQDGAEALEKLRHRRKPKRHVSERERR